MADRKQLAAVLIKVVVSVAIIAALAASADMDQIVQRLGRIGPGLFALALSLLSLLCLPHLLRWQILLARLGIDLPPRQSLQIIYVGYFFNQTLPSTVGGDFARLWYVHRYGISLNTALAAVLVDRVAGLAGILVLGLALGAVYADVLGPHVAYGISALSAAALVAALVFLHAAERIQRLIPLRPVRALAAISRSLNSALVSRGGIFAIAISVLIQLGAGAGAYLIAASAGVPLGFGDSILLFPLITLATVLPVSLAGWGVREGAAVVVLGMVGISREDALVVSVLFGLALLLVALPGGIVWIMRRRST